MKGWKLIVLSAHQNAQMANAFKDKPAGKEHRGSPTSAPDYRKTSMENFIAVLPKNISDKKRSLIEKRLFPSR